MRRKSFADMNCSVARSLDVVGDPWTLLIVRDLFRRIGRFGDLQASLGIPRNTLTARLNDLVDSGIVQRVEYQSRPPRYDYTLTAKGRALGPVILTLMAWGDQWADKGEPLVVTVERATGRRITPIFVDEQTGIPITDQRFETRAADQ